MDEIAQIIGSLIILVPFVLAQLHRLAATSWLYLVLNLVGSIILAVEAARGRQWGFLLLELVWSGVSLYSLARMARSDSANQPLS